MINLWTSKSNGFLSRARDSTTVCRSVSRSISPLVTLCFFGAFERFWSYRPEIYPLKPEIWLPKSAIYPFGTEISPLWFLRHQFSPQATNLLSQAWNQPFQATNLPSQASNEPSQDSLRRMDLSAALLPLTPIHISQSCKAGKRVSLITYRPWATCFLPN